MMKSLDQFTHLLSRAFGVVAALCVGLMMLTLTFDVVAKATTGIVVQGIYELVETLVLVVAFLGLAYTERSDSTVRVTLLTSRLLQRKRTLLEVFGNVMAALTAAWISYSFWGSALASFASQETSSGIVQFPLWPARLAAALGMTLGALELALTAWRKWDAQKTVNKNVNAGTHHKFIKGGI